MNAGYGDEDPRDRSEAAARRGRELRERGQELSRRLAQLRAGEPSRPSDATAAALAEEAERRSSEEATARAAVALRRSAEAHERAAGAHERAARLGIGDVADHRARAAEHRGHAELDHRAATRYSDGATDLAATESG